MWRLVAVLAARVAELGLDDAPLSEAGVVRQSTTARES